MKPNRFMTGAATVLALAAAMVVSRQASAQTLVDPAPAATAAEESGQNVTSDDARPSQRRSILRRPARSTTDPSPAAASEAPVYRAPDGAATAVPVQADANLSPVQSNQRPGLQPQSYPDQPATYSQPYGRPYLGVSFDQRYPNAAVVRSVNAGSPAEQAGLRPGDTIHAINNSGVSSYQHVIDFVGSLRPGDQLEVAFSRRIDDRTQIVLAGRQLDQPQTASYGVENSAPKYSQPPTPAGVSQGGATADYNAAPGVPTPIADGQSATAEDNEGGGLLNRNRTESRPERSRGLLRRRN